MYEFLVKGSLVVGLLLAVLPSFLPIWKWFLWGILFYVFYIVSFLFFSAYELSKEESGEGAAVLGVSVYTSLTLAVLFLSCLLKFVVLGILKIKRR